MDIDIETGNFLEDASMEKAEKKNMMVNFIQQVENTSANTSNSSLRLKLQKQEI